MQHEYDILITATIEIGGRYQAETLEEAIETAKLELRSQGQLSDLSVSRAIMLDEDLMYGTTSGSASTTHPSTIPSSPVSGIDS